MKTTQLDEILGEYVRAKVAKADDEIELQAQRLANVFPRLGIAIVGGDWALVEDYATLIASYAEQAKYWTQEKRNFGGR